MTERWMRNLEERYAIRILNIVYHERNGYDSGGLVTWKTAL